MKNNEAEKYQTVEIDGFECLLSYARLSQEEIPENCFKYSFRHDDEGDNFFAEIQKGIMVNHSYDVISKNELDCDKINEALDLFADDYGGDMVCPSDEDITIEEYLSR